MILINGIFFQVMQSKILLKNMDKYLVAPFQAIMKTLIHSTIDFPKLKQDSL